MGKNGRKQHHFIDFAEDFGKMTVARRSFSFSDEELFSTAMWNDRKRQIVHFESTDIPAGNSIMNVSAQEGDRGYV